MFYFSGTITLAFQLSYGGEPITPDDVTVTIYLDGAAVSTGAASIYGDYYNYSFDVSDNDIAPNYYNEYRYLVETEYSGERVIANGFFVVHLSDYDNMDTTEVWLSNQNSVVYLQCNSSVGDACSILPPVKPNIVSVELMKSCDPACRCIK